MNRRRGRGDVIDRSWAGIRYVRAYVGLEVPGGDALRGALVRVARAAPVVARRFAADGSWQAVADRDLDGWAASVVTVVDEAQASTDRIFDLAGARALPSRFHLVAGPDWVALAADHAFGDGQTADMLVAQLLAQAASTAPVAPPWRRLGAVRRDAAIAAGVARGLGSLRWMLDHRAALAGGAYGPLAAAEPHRVVVEVSDAEFMERLRAARDDRYRGASAAALVGAGLRAGIATTLGEPRPGFECLFNARTPRRGGWSAWGNWSVGAYLEPADDYDPRSVRAAMDEARRRGVAAYGLASARVAAARAGTDAEDAGPRGVLPEGRPRLTLSYMSSRTFDAVPGFVPGQTLVVTDSVPNGLDTLTFQTVESGGRIAVSTAFYPESWDLAAVSAGVRRFLDDGVDLLARRVAGPVR